MYKLSIVSQKQPLDPMYIPQQLVCDPIKKIWVTKETFEAFYEMNRAIQKEGYGGFTLLRGYLCFAYQKKQYLNQVEAYKRQGKTLETAHHLAREVIMPPGCSEHQLGVAVDIGTKELEEQGDWERYIQVPQIQWLLAHAHEYGFILRYPPNKRMYTELSFKPWHYRYVGIGHAKKMKKLNLCLEEYIQLFYHN